MSNILINGHTIEPETQVEGGKYFTPDASHSNYILLQCQEFLSAAQYQELESLHVCVLEYINFKTYLCRYEPSDLEVLRNLPFVVSASVFHEDFVTTTHLKSKVQTALTTTVHKTLTAEQLTEESDLQPQSPAPDTETPYGQTFDVYLGLHPGFVRTLTEIKQHLVDILHQDPNDIEVHDNVVHMKLRADDFQTVAGIDEVRNIAEVILPEPCNNEARSVMNFPTMVTAEVTSTGALLEGTDQIVAVADTGFDMGAQAVGTAASPPFLYMFQDFQPPITPVNRIIALLPDNNRTSTDIRDKTKDTLCHGTFVCGNIAACGNGGNILPGPDLSHTLIKGTAPRARLVVQVCGDDNNMIVPNKSLKDLFDEAYYLGARTHNNSYATRPTGPTHAIINYASSTNHAQAIDEYTYGIDRQDMLVVFAAGNDGAMARPGGGIQTISDFALAKNCITVGACENRRFINYPATWYKFVDSGAPQCPYNMADFSSTGPPRTPQMRNKPDLVAPGACIYSTCTHDRGWPGYLVGGTGPGTANPISQYDRTLNGNSVDPNWTFNSGTSFSAPFVSGCAAVLREAILHKRHEFFFGSPWAVTIKALLVNGAVDLSDGGYPHNRGYLPGIPPDPFQGFGRVDITASLRNVFDDLNAGFGQYTIGQQDLMAIPPKGSWTHSLTNSPTSFSLKATLVWADRKGDALQSHLMLRADHNPSGTCRYANGDGNVADQLNNVQKLVWPNVPPGVVTLNVTASAILIRTGVDPPNLTQNFAICWIVGPVTAHH